jgi:hypothetical protein
MSFILVFCPYRCRFCPGWRYSGGYWVPRDPKRIFEEISRMIARSYTKVALRIIRRKGLWLFLTQWVGWKYRIARGLLCQRAALARAHLDVLATAEPTAGAPLP